MKVEQYFTLHQIHEDRKVSMRLPWKERREFNMSLQLDIGMSLGVT